MDRVWHEKGKLIKVENGGKMVGVYKEGLIFSTLLLSILPGIVLAITSF